MLFHHVTSRCRTVHMSFFSWNHFAEEVTSGICTGYNSAVSLPLIGPSCCYSFTHQAAHLALYKLWSSTQCGCLWADTDAVALVHYIDTQQLHWALWIIIKHILHARGEILHILHVCVLRHDWKLRHSETKTLFQLMDRWPVQGLGSSLHMQEVNPHLQKGGSC